MIVTAYQANDGKLFSMEDKPKYLKHMRKLAAERRYERKLDELRKKEREFWENEFWNKVRSIPQLKAAMLKHAHMLGLNGLKNESWYSKKRPPGPPILKEMSISAEYSSRVSNTHSCPHNGKTNWGGREEGVPRGYPGFSGRMEYKVEWYDAWNSWYPGGSDMWKGSRVHTGTGGGGGFKVYGKKDEKGLQSFGYGFEIFLDDWPALKDAFEKAIVYGDLKFGPGHYDVKVLMEEMNPAEDYA